MISLTYSCGCGWASGLLDEAQFHSNTTGHHVKVSGFMTPNAKTTFDRAELSITDRARAIVREAEILRRARDKGLVKP